MTRNLLIVIGSFFLIGLLPSWVAMADDDVFCERFAKKKKNTLIGDGGAQGESFRFQHLADYDEANGTTTIIHAVKNLIGDKAILPFQWTDGGFLFKKLRTCKSNSYDTRCPAQEVASKLIYGPAKQHEKEARAYKPDDNAQKKTDGRPLQSKLYSADYDPPLDFRFTSLVTKENEFIYEALLVGKGHRKLSMKIEEFGKLWQGLVESYKLTIDNTTKTWMEQREGIKLPIADKLLNEKQGKQDTPKTVAKFAMRGLPSEFVEGGFLSCSSRSRTPSQLKAVSLTFTCQN